MKRMLSIQSWLFGMCLTSLFILSSCEPTVVSPCQEETDNRILRFKEYCYDTSGNVCLEQPAGFATTEWMIPVETNTDVQALFHRLTGLQVHPAEKYEYSYHSGDDRYAVRIVGTSQPANQKYASLYLRIEGCPEIETIHFVGTRPTHSVFR